MGQSPESSTYNKCREGIPFFQGNADFGDRHPLERLWCSKPKKIAYEGDILISVRAPIGALNVADQRCCIGRGLASLHPSEHLDRDYLYYFLFSKEEYLKSKGTGSTFKAISKKQLEDLLIPLPSILEQKKRSNILNKLWSNTIRRREQLRKLDELVKCRFVEMFGDPVLNPLSWVKNSLGKLGSLGRGVSKHRPRNAAILLNGSHPLIQTGDVAASNIYIEKYLSTYSDYGLQQSKKWPENTLCITIAANIAKTAILKFDSCFPDSVVGFISGKKTHQIFIHVWFSFFQSILEAQAPQSAQKNLNLKALKRLQVITPPIHLQNKFASFVQQLDKSRFAIDIMR